MDKEITYFFLFYELNGKESLHFKKKVCSCVYTHKELSRNNNT